ncbi:hypothetical protein BS78_07G118700 [Paspalum vaginatum]|nr:hypothetical protein BS78_07G118700 [Paspalum vaginatum]
MFMFLICHLHLPAMFNVEMNLSSFISGIHVLEMLLFVAVACTYGFYLSYMLVLFGIRIFNLFKYIGSISLISLKPQQSRKPIREMALSSDVIKPEVFDGACFKRRQIKTRMWLTDLKLFWVVLSDVPEAASDKADDAAKAAVQAEKAKWDEANQACLSRLENVSSHRLFDVYFGFTSAKGLWAELENEFSEVDNGNESFTTENYLNYKMVEGRSIMEQLQEIQLLVRDLVQYGCNVLESFQVNAILAKLPPSWRDFVTARRHMKNPMTPSELSAAINVEEHARASNKPSQQVQAHLVEKGEGRKNQKKKKNPPQQNQNQLKPKNIKKKKEDFICYVCGDSGHIARKCSKRKGKGPPPQCKEGNMVVNSTSGYAPLAFMASSSDDWWIDLGATVHICADGYMFSSFQGCSSGPILMGNGVPAAVRGTGQVCLKLTSGKTLVLKDILYVPSMNRNLISMSPLLRQGLKKWSRLSLVLLLESRTSQVVCFAFLL